MNLGLDLQGGSYLLYSVDTVALRNERLTNLTEDVRKTLTDDQIAFTRAADELAGSLLEHVVALERLGRIRQ